MMRFAEPKKITDASIARYVRRRWIVRRHGELWAVVERRQADADIHIVQIGVFVRRRDAAEFCQLKRDHHADWMRSDLYHAFFPK